MSKSSWGSFHSLGAVIATAGWPIAIILASILYLDFFSLAGEQKKFDADEIKCRSREQSRIAEEYATGKKVKPANGEQGADEKAARETCAQRRATIASERQADYAALALIVGFLALAATVAAAVAAGIAAWATKATADEAERSADYAGDAIVASTRAWIRRDKITFSAPLNFHSDGLLESSVDFEFTNVGNAPALHVNKFAWFIAVTDGKVPKERAEKLFAQKRANPVSDGFTLFPSQSYPKPGQIPVGQSLVLSAEKTTQAVDEAGRLSLYVAACINYSFATDSKTNHQTCCLFEVGTPWDIKSGLKIPKDQLSLREFAGFGGMDVAD